jgi:uncharacterized membrane protein YccC
MARGSGNGASQFVVSLIGLFGVLAGAAIGAGVTLYLNREEKEEEARGVARVLHEQFRAADDAMSRTLDESDYQFYKLDTGLPLSDQKRLSTKLTGKEFRDVAEATARLKLQVARSRAQPKFGKDERIQVRCLRLRLALGRKALATFSQLDDPEVDRDVRRFRGAYFGGVDPPEGGSRNRYIAGLIPKPPKGQPYSLWVKNEDNKRRIVAGLRRCALRVSTINIYLARQTATARYSRRARSR